jgi:transcriptional regulator GlxA family with amidase domain
VTFSRSKFAFLTLPRYSMIALSNAVEPLRMANSITGQSVYEWSIVSLDGQPTPASNGLQLSPTHALDALGAVDILFVCGGVDVQAAVSPKILAALKRLAERRVPLGALCTGGHALAKAGLLDRYRATIHWENLSALREEFPRIQLSDQLFSIDRDRFTCSGGVAPLDLMLHLVESKHGAHVSQLISEQFIVDRVRSDRDRQYVPLRAQIGVSHESLIKVAQLMEENIEKPLVTMRSRRHRAVALADRAPVQTPPELRAQALLPADVPAPRARAAAADLDADHRHHDRLRLSVPAALLALLPRPVRLPAERGAPEPRRQNRRRRPRRTGTGLRWCARARLALLRRLSLCGMSRSLSSHCLRYPPLTMPW